MQFVTVLLAQETPGKSASGTGTTEAFDVLV